MTEGNEFTTARKRFIVFIIVLAVVDIAYRLVYATGWSRTAALYVGIPTAPRHRPGPDAPDQERHRDDPQGLVPGHARRLRGPARGAAVPPVRGPAGGARLGHRGRADRPRPQAQPGPGPDAHGGVAPAPPHEPRGRGRLALRHPRHGQLGHHRRRHARPGGGGPGRPAPVRGLPARRSSRSASTGPSGPPGRASRSATPGPSSSPAAPTTTIPCGSSASAATAASTTTPRCTCGWCESAPGTGRVRGSTTTAPCCPVGSTSSGRWSRGRRSRATPPAPGCGGRSSTSGSCTPPPTSPRSSASASDQAAGYLLDAVIEAPLR